jgi:hypothetical protein
MEEGMMCYGKTLKDGDEALVEFDINDPKTRHFCDDAKALNGTVVIVKHVDGYDDGWWVKNIVWFKFECFKPVSIKPVSNTIIILSSSTGYCFCNLPDLKDSYAGGNKFLFCRTCRKERL